MLFSRPIQQYLPKDKTLFDYQLEDVFQVCEIWKNRSVYLGHQMGLGKSAMSIVSWNYLKAKKILIICPAAVRSVWKTEIPEWSIWPYKVQSLTQESDRLREDADIIIVSYELAITPAIARELVTESWDVIVFDECHCLGNTKSMRTRFCLGNLFSHQKAKCFFLSGSIARDKILNVQPVFRALCPEQIPPYWGFVNKYCYTEKGKFGTKVLGGKNLKALGRIARTFFLIRRMKKDVLKDLPEKLEQKIMLELPDYTAAKRLQSASRDFEPAVIRALEKGQDVQLDENLAALRQEIGLAKVPLVVEQALQFLGLGETEGDCQKIVIFCHHQSVCRELTKLLNNHVQTACIHGGTSDGVRESIKKEFKENPAMRVLVGTAAIAEGLTLTTANMILYAEMSWSLATNEQVQDRLHRIGQKKTVYVKYLLLEETLDTLVYTMYKRKAGDKRRTFDNVRSLRQCR